MLSQSYAKHVLQEMADDVRDLPTGDMEQADFLVTFGSCQVLVEEKTKFDNLRKLAEREEVLRSGKIHNSSTSLARNNRLSGLVGKAAKQHSSSFSIDHDFRVIWFTGAGLHSEAQCEQFINTIYGTTIIIERNSLRSRDCYFFRNSDFYRYSNILDGAIAAHVSNDQIHLKLCLNPLSKNYEDLKDSDLAKKFGTAVEDPVVREVAGDAFMLDGPIDRNDNAALLEYLQSKYNTDYLMNIDMGHTAATVLVPNGER
jgi:hypothetical protein